MSWKKHVSIVSQDRRLEKSLEKNRRNYNTDQRNSSSNKFSSVLPEVYAGHPLRLDRYTQYDAMDIDAEINAALDTIADFSTQDDEKSGSMFRINFSKDITKNEVEILHHLLKQWAKVNKFKQRLWRIFRNTIKYGDQFFVRDPETLEWMWIDQTKLEKIQVNEAEGKIPIGYLVRDLDINLTSLTATQSDQYGNNIQGTGTNALQNVTSQSRFGNVSKVGRFNDNIQNTTVVDAAHIIHLSLGEGLDANWPFGTSILESIFKTFRQKELLEDAILIYRIQRAPERRVFYVDVGNMPPHRSGAYIERVKTEIHQRRLPNKSGGGQSVIDGAYNPLCLDMNTRIPLLDGRILNITELSEEYKNGKENWVYSCNPITGEIIPGNITWAGITNKSAQVIKIILNNGNILICTPDHKIPVLHKGFVEAQNLTNEDILISYLTKYKKYQKIYNHSVGKWKYTHKIVAKFFKKINKHQVFNYSSKYYNKDKNIIIHKDFNNYNNDPRNLSFMNKRDYKLFLKETNNISFSEENINNKTITVLDTKIDSIEWLKETMEVGTITIDGPERWHSHHTFAIETGIFVKNSMIEDYFFATSSDNRGSRVETLPGGASLGEIDDLKYFNNKMIRGLRVPSSYIPTGPEDGTAVMNDGRAGTAYIQEYRFAQYCQRLQRSLSPIFDAEFKLFIKQRGVDGIDSAMFDLDFNVPQHFSDFAKLERDGALINVFEPLSNIKYLSRKFVLKRFLGLTDEEISINESLWCEENQDITENNGPESAGASSGASGLDSLGIRPDSSSEMPSGDESFDDQTNFPESPISGGEDNNPSLPSSTTGGDLNNEVG